MKTHFRTNVDCCKNLVNDLNAGRTLQDSNPLKGDNVIIWESPNVVIELVVVERTWQLDGFLEVELNLNSIWSELGHVKFEEFVKNRYQRFYTSDFRVS